MTEFNATMPIDPVKNEDGTYTLAILSVGKSDRSGKFFPQGEIEKAVERFQKRRGSLRGEIENPRQREGESSEDFTTRTCSIDEGNVSHELIKGTIEIKDGMVFGKIKPIGPHAGLIEKFHQEGSLNVAMRAFCKLNVVDGQTVASDLSIVSFDLCSSPLKNKEQ